jgi:hypothetical protein
VKHVSILKLVIGWCEHTICSNRHVVADNNAITNVENASRVDKGAAPNHYVASATCGLDFYKRIDIGVGTNNYF